jgi:tRNA(Ile)-lysidine synthase
LAADPARLLGRCRFPPGALVCAVSGGPDSLALLVLACASRDDVTAVHVDHSLRSGSAAEADVVRDAAGRFGARFEALRVDVPAGPNLEARARAVRYAALPPAVCTGHTADDRAETVLLNLLRGAGLDGLAALRVDAEGGGGRPHRPLLRLRRHETRALCDHLGLVPVEDPTNRDPMFRRNRVRHELLPLLDAVAQRDVVAVLARQAELLADDAALLDELASRVDPTDAHALAATPLPLARRAVRDWLRSGSDDEHHPPDAATVERVLAVARGEATATDVGGRRRVARSRGRLRLVDGTVPHR